MAKDIAILAYSGGLDSTISIDWIKENYGYDVITVSYTHLTLPTKRIV